MSLTQYCADAGCSITSGVHIMNTAVQHVAPVTILYVGTFANYMKLANAMAVPGFNPQCFVYARDHLAASQFPTMLRFELCIAEMELEQPPTDNLAGLTYPQFTGADFISYQRSEDRFRRSILLENDAFPLWSNPLQSRTIAGPRFGEDGWAESLAVFVLSMLHPKPA